MKWFKRLFPFIFLTALVVGAVFLFSKFLRIDRSEQNPVPTVEEIRLEDFTYSPDDGYTFLPAPFGTPEEKMRELFGYTTSENTTAYGSPTFDLLGLPANYDATFAYKENSPMHAISFSVSSGGEAECTAEEVEAGYAEVLAYFELTFGPADETETRENVLGDRVYHTWWAADGSNYLSLSGQGPSGRYKDANFRILLCEPINYFKD